MPFSRLRLLQKYEKCESRRWHYYILEFVMQKSNVEIVSHNSRELLGAKNISQQGVPKIRSKWFDFSGLKF